MEEGGILTLLHSMAVECRILAHTRGDDKYGSSIDSWSETTAFNAVIIKNSTTEATIAERQGVSEIFTVVTFDGFRLSYHDVFRRVSDGQTFRVTGNTADSDAPAASSVKIAKVSAEKWVPQNA